MSVKHFTLALSTESRYPKTKTLERKMAEKGGFEPPTPF